jgi:hypothetical protein
MVVAGDPDASRRPRGREWESSRDSALLVFSAAADCRLHAMPGSFPPRSTICDWRTPRRTLLHSSAAEGLPTAIREPHGAHRRSSCRLLEPAPPSWPPRPSSTPAPPRARYARSPSANRRSPRLATLLIVPKRADDVLTRLSIRLVPVARLAPPISPIARDSPPSARPRPPPASPFTSSTARSETTCPASRCSS